MCLRFHPQDKKKFHYRRIKKPITNETGTVQIESEEEREWERKWNRERKWWIEDERVDEDSDSECEQDVD